MIFTIPTEPQPVVWEESLLDTKMEAQLTQSIREARRIPNAAPLGAIPIGGEKDRGQNITAASETVAGSTLSQLIGGCGIAAIDGYLAMRDYAAERGLDLVELHHKGIDLQDLISTLVIHTQRMAEMEGRAAGGQRWKR